MGKSATCCRSALAVIISLAGISSAAVIDKGAGDSSRIVLLQNAPQADVSLSLSYIAAENIGELVTSVFNPESHYEFEFVAGTLDISDGSDFTATRSAFSTWIDLEDSAVSMTETFYDGIIALGGTNGQNEVSWIPYTGTNWWTDVLGYSPSYIAVAVTWYIPATGQIVERDLHFNDTYMYWYTDSDGAKPSKDPFYVGHIALHETGHLYGLKDIYNPGSPGYEPWMGTDNEELTMYGYSNPLDEDITLTAIDIAAMALAHPVPEPATLCLLGLGFLNLKRRRI